MKHLLCLFLLLVAFVFNSAAEIIGKDSSEVQARSIKKESIEQYRGTNGFVYEEPSKQDGFWDVILRKLGKLFNRNFDFDQQYSIWSIIIYGIMTISIILIVLNLMGVDIKGFFGRKAKTTVPYTVQEEDIREMDLDVLIAEAIQNREWRLCIRYHYLKGLRLLSDRELISWQPGKTNYDYYFELRSNHLKDHFKTVTLLFENVWYGNKQVEEDNYRETRQGFEDFYKEIGGERRS